jgi:hypothetical protein
MLPERGRLKPSLRSRLLPECLQFLRRSALTCSKVETQAEASVAAFASDALCLRTRETRLPDLVRDPAVAPVTSSHSPLRTVVQRHVRLA